MQGDSSRVARSPQIDSSTRVHGPRPLGGSQCPRGGVAWGIRLAHDAEERGMLLAILVATTKSKRQRACVSFRPWRAHDGRARGETLR